MDGIKYLNTNNIRDWITQIKVGQEILLSGVVYCARDAVHKKIFEFIKNGEKLPFDIKDSVIYYCGPTPEKPGMAIGSCGPTTSSRMDLYTPEFHKLGLACTIGKGGRSKEVISSIIENKCAYLCAMGGAGALAAQSVEKVQVIAFPDLGCESMKKMIFKDFPLVVGIDSFGNSIFDKI